MHVIVRIPCVFVPKCTEDYPDCLTDWFCLSERSERAILCALPSKQLTELADCGLGFLATAPNVSLAYLVTVAIQINENLLVILF